MLIGYIKILKAGGGAQTLEWIIVSSRNKLKYLLRGIVYF